MYYYLNIEYCKYLNSAWQIKIGLTMNYIDQQGNLWFLIDGQYVDNMIAYEMSIISYDTKESEVKIYIDIKRIFIYIHFLFWTLNGQYLSKDCLKVLMDRK